MNPSWFKLAPNGVASFAELMLALVFLWYVMRLKPKTADTRLFIYSMVVAMLTFGVQFLFNNNGSPKLYMYLDRIQMGVLIFSFLFNLWLAYVLTGDILRLEKFIVMLFWGAVSLVALLFYIKNGAPIKNLTYLFFIPLCTWTTHVFYKKAKLVYRSEGRNRKFKLLIAMTIWSVMQLVVWIFVNLLFFGYLIHLTLPFKIWTYIHHPLLFISITYSCFAYLNYAEESTSFHAKLVGLVLCALLILLGLAPFVLSEMLKSLPNHEPFLQRMLMGIWMLIPMTTLLVVIGLPLFFRHGLLGPLNRIIKGVQRINAGDLSTEVKFEINDEVGQLALQFNEMTHSLRMYSQEMEQLVAKRTTELSLKNRELEIEAALERVRARTMAMQYSDELADASLLLFQEMKKLGLTYWTSGFCIWRTDGSCLVENWMNVGVEEKLLPPLLLPYLEDDGHRGIYEASLRGERMHEQKIEGEALTKHYNLMMSIPSAKTVFQKIKEAGLTPPPIQWKYAAIFKQGYLLFVAAESQPNTSIMAPRFAKVFEQTYTRFLDLQKAEKQAREAIIEAALERVRAEIASMRTTNDLQRIIPLIWKELTILQVPFIRCGVFIMDEAREKVLTYLSTPDGQAIASFELPFDGEGLTPQVVAHWRKQSIFTDEWDEAQFQSWSQSLVQQGLVASNEAYQTNQPPSHLCLHFIPFLQGMLYVGNISVLTQDEIQDVQSLASAFATAYARYQDFSQLEVAKKQVENTLQELRSTQSQLIQSEKLASLGELTAGIAHEIQNPLNFVNNFAEVSAEMLDEMHEELEKGDTTEAIAIATDLKTNLEKINHHGQRASSIVKGMLEHSRTSSGVKEPTDLNTLADEYLRLAYHGLRAKDNNFNATMETHFDPNLPKVSVIPQDIGRVLLNLINNAFYAVAERSRSTVGAPLAGAQPYMPTVIVSTKKLENAIEIRVQDNGPGIPEAIRDKIFQPFFTTKPTGQGTGLGLSLAYDIVTKGHGGSLEVNSKPNEGTEFVIRLV